MEVKEVEEELGVGGSLWLSTVDSRCEDRCCPLPQHHVCLEEENARLAAGSFEPGFEDSSRRLLLASSQMEGWAPASERLPQRTFKIKKNPDSII